MKKEHLHSFYLYCVFVWDVCDVCDVCDVFCMECSVSKEIYNCVYFSSEIPVDWTWLSLKHKQRL